MPYGFECYPYADGDRGMLSRSDETKGEGETCVGNEECESNICYPNAFGTGTAIHAVLMRPPPRIYLLFLPPWTDACLPDSLVP